MRERSRGRPPGGFPHALFSLDLGVTHRCARCANDGQIFYSEHPTCVYSPRFVPTRRTPFKIIQQCGGNLETLCCSWVCARIVFWGRFRQRQETTQGG